MSIAHARALVPEAHIQGFEYTNELSALSSLGRWASRFSPLVQIESPHEAKHRGSFANDEWYYGISIDISASLQLFGGLSSILAHLERALDRFGLDYRIAVAPSLGAAWALSRFSGERAIVVRKPLVEEKAASLPLSALRLPTETCRSLEEVGITRIKDVLAIARKQLTVRFGHVISTRIDQLLGNIEEPISPITTKHIPKCSVQFSSPVTDIRSVLLASKKALSELIDTTRSSGKAARKISLTLKRYKANDISKDLTLHFPSNNDEHLWSLLKPRLENIHLGHGVEEVCASTTEQARYEPTLAAMWKEFSEQGSSPQHIGELIDVLMAQLGEESIVVHHQIHSHIPEKSLSFVPASLETLQQTEPLPTNLPNRPSKLFRIPEKIQALSMLPDKPPHKIQWNKQALGITLGIGPERIAPEWWKENTNPTQRCSRDYFTLQTTDGTWLWVFRDTTTSHWYLQGVYA